MNVWERIEILEKMYIETRNFTGCLAKYFDQYLPDGLDTRRLIDIACDDNLYNECKTAFKLLKKISDDVKITLDKI